MRLHTDVHLGKRVQDGREYWRATWTGSDGTQQWRGLGACDKVLKRDAQRACRQLERDFATGAVSDSRLVRCPTLTSALEGCAEARSKNQGNYNCWKRTLALWQEWDKDKNLPVDMVTRQHATEFRAWISKQGLGEQTCRHHISRIRTCINDLVRHEVLRSNVFDHIPAGVLRRDKSWDHIPAGTVLGAVDHPDCDPDAALGLLLARFAGLRANEIGRLREGDVDLSGRTLAVVNPNADGAHSTKKRARVVPVQPALLERLPRFMVGDSQRVMLGTSLDLLRKRRIPESLSVAGVTPWPEPLQVLRRSCITDWCSMGLSVADVAEIAGNSADVVMKHYFKTRRETIDRVAQNGLAGLRSLVWSEVEALDAAGLEKVLEFVRSCQNHVRRESAKPSQEPERASA